MARRCVVVDLGSVDYTTAWDKQKEAVESPDRDECDLLYLVEHPPTITIGRSSDRRNVLASEEELTAQGIELLEVDRGGDVTYHGPGQLVAYPILNLNRHKRDVGWYLRSLEEVIIRTLLDLEIEAKRIKGYTGVWVGDEKVAALGIAVRRWITFHGAALNIRPRLDHFALITPCGIEDKGVTSVCELLGKDVDRSEVVARFVRRFGEVFGLETVCLDDAARAK
jgi:lipoyl(octanoyl) transferase